MRAGGPASGGQPRIVQFRYGADNLGYLVAAGGECLAIDGGAAGAILEYCAAHDLTLRYVANTHGHGDHTSGNSRLLAGSQAHLLTREVLLGENTLSLGGVEIRVIATPGHTEDSLCFYTGQALIAGDTLFNGTIGNCFSGDLQAFYRSVLTLMALPDETLVYAGHDYVLDSLAFARYLEPGNTAIDAFLEHYDPGHVVSTIADEKRINPYFRFNAPAIVRFLEARGLSTGTQWERWQSLLRIE